MFAIVIILGAFIGGLVGLGVYVLFDKASTKYRERSCEINFTLGYSKRELNKKEKALKKQSLKFRKTSERLLSVGLVLAICIVIIFGAGFGCIEYASEIKDKTIFIENHEMIENIYEDGLNNIGSGNEDISYVELTKIAKDENYRLITEQNGMKQWYSWYYPQLLKEATNIIYQNRSWYYEDLF
jgi:hypothetical protein